MYDGDYYEQESLKSDLECQFREMNLLDSAP